MNSTLTEQDILDAIKSLDLPGRSQPDLFYPSTFMGMKVMTTPPEPPKQKLSARLNVSSKFRAEYDAWLLEFFGTQDPILPPGKVFMFGGFNSVIMRPEDAVVLQNIGGFRDEFCGGADVGLNGRG